MDSAIDPLRLLRPPGRGILSFTTGARQNIDLEKRYFGRILKTTPWAEHVQDLLDKSLPFYILGAPSDAGAGICRGSNHGPQYLREELYRRSKHFTSLDLGDLPVIPQLSDDDLLSEEQKRRSGTALWGADYESKMPVSPLNLLDASLQSLWHRRANARVFVVGGDHSLSEAVVRALDAQKKVSDLAVLHLDAHTDLLEERFGIRHCFATWAAHAIRRLPQPNAWVQVGIRVSGKDKNHWENKFGLKQLWAAEVLKQKPENLARRLVQDWKALGKTKLYISLDVDALDASLVPATGTPETKGLSSSWTKSFLRSVLSEMDLVACDLMELAPVLGSASEGRRSVRLAADLSEILTAQWHVPSARKKGRR